MAEMSREAEAAALHSFPAVLLALEEVGVPPDPQDGGPLALSHKQLSRARVLHAVLSHRFPEVRLDDLRMMGEMGIHALLDLSFAAETEMVDAAFDDAAAPPRRLECLLLALDGARRWGAALTRAFREVGRVAEEAGGGTAAAEGSAGREGGGGPDGGASGREGREERRGHSQAAVAELMRKGLSLDGLQDALPVDADAAAAEAQVLGVDLWEALCWRCGAVRYYRVSSAVKADTRVADAEKEAEGVDRLNAATAAAVAPHAAMVEEATEALLALLAARGAKAQRNQLLAWGIYSTTHLLALAYAAELSYWRWTTEACVGEGDDGCGKEDGGVRGAGDEGDECGSAGTTLWKTQSLRLLHRYLYVVEVGMEGCGWSTERIRELLRRIGGEDALRPLLQVEWTLSPVDEELARLQTSGMGSTDPTSAQQEAVERHKLPKQNAKKKGKKGKK